MTQGSQGQLLLYKEDGAAQVQVTLLDGSVWMTQKDIAQMFERSVPTINEHINRIYSEGELEEERTIRNSLIVQTEGQRDVTRNVTSYNLEMIIAVGYRVNSVRGTQFRQWATNRLNEYVTKGFVLDEARLSDDQGKHFDELVERVRKIRTSEKSFYCKVRDIFATSIDYDTNMPVAEEFFATMQNKFHYVAHGHTAAEIIAERVNHKKVAMGLTN